MTIRNLDAVFAPRSVAVVGASCREASVGKTVLDGIIAGGFTGRIYPVNPKYGELSGLRCYRRIADLPEAPDLAVIVTPPATVPGLIAELGECGGKLAVVITAGITQNSGLRQRVLDAARPHQLRIIGPNTIGLQSPRATLNASFVPLQARKGGLGLVSQSGAIVSSLVDWAVAEGIGFSQVLSLGDMADVDVGDCINLLAEDPSTSAIHLGGSRGRAGQAGDRGQAGPTCGGRTGCANPYRRACRCRYRGRRGAASRGRDPGQ